MIFKDPVREYHYPYATKHVSIKELAALLGEVQCL